MATVVAIVHKEKVTPAGLTIAAPPDQRFEIEPNAADLPSTGRRTAYARWLTTGTHPLVTRVLTNRVWMHHFGRGIVATPNDFGTRGERPSHPQLLDWLAGQLIRHQWKLKPIHRLIVTSSTYMQAGAVTDAAMSKDP